MEDGAETVELADSAGTVAGLPPLTDDTAVGDLASRVDAQQTAPKPAALEYLQIPSVELLAGTLTPRLVAIVRQ